MKRLLPILLLAPLASAEEEPDIPLGLEVLTGYRTAYVDRGFKLASDLIEVQLGGELALSDILMLEFGGWYGTGTGSGSFDQTEGFLSLRYDAENWDVSLDTSYRGYSHPVFEDGFLLGPSANWYPNDDWRVGALLHHDTGASGWYGAVETAWSQPTGRDSFVSALIGVSAVSDFYGRDGLNDAYGRLSWTYQFNRHVAVTPFLGTSVGLDSAASDHLFGGLWFEVNF